MTIEKLKELVEEVCEQFSNEQITKDVETSRPGLDKSGYKRESALCLSKFTRSPHNLLLNEELLKDHQSIPAMFWRKLGADIEILHSPRKLLQFYLDKRTTGDGFCTNGHNTSSLAQAPLSGSLSVSFSASRTVAYAGISYTVTEDMSNTSVVLDDFNTFDSYELPLLAEDDGEYYEERDDYEYNHDYSEWSDTYDEDVDIDSITYTDSEGNEHDIDPSYPDEVIAECMGIEDRIQERIEAEEEEEEGTPNNNED